jgi:rhamnose transport system permease protein
MKGDIKRNTSRVGRQPGQEQTAQTVMLWNTRDLGFLTVHTAAQLARKRMDQNVTSIQAGRLGAIEVRAREVILGPPLIMNKANIDEFNF